MYRREKAIFLKIGSFFIIPFLLAILIHIHSLPASGAGAALPRPLTTANCSITNIEAITYDEQTGEAIVIGTTNPTETEINEIYLLDNGTIALRMSFTSQSPGVSLEKIVGTEEFQQMEYFPILLKDTHAGAMLAWADISLKQSSLGVDNYTDPPTPININVPGYKSIPQLLEEKNWVFTQPVSWRIFIELKPRLLTSTDGRNDIGFEPDRVVRVDWAFEEGSYEDPTVAAAMQEYVDHLNAHYDEYAAEFGLLGNSGLQEVVELGKLTALARWIFDKNIPLPIAGEPLHDPPSEESPDQVPIVAVTVNVTSARTGNSPVTGPYSINTESPDADDTTETEAAVILHGGVDFSPTNTYVADTSGAVQQLATDVRNARTGDETCWSASSSAQLSSWPAAGPNATYTALAVSLAGSLSRSMLPTVLKLPPTPAPTPTPTPVPLANWQINNQAGGPLLAELVGYASHVFPTGISTWSGIAPGTYSYRLTAQGGPCNGAVLTGSITFSSGVTVSETITCG